MISKKKPKIGLLGIMHGLYDEKQPEITKKQEGFALSIVKQLRNIAEIDFPGAAKSRKLVEDYVKRFNNRDYDGIMIVMLLYSPGLRKQTSYHISKYSATAFSNSGLELEQANNQSRDTRCSRHSKHDFSGKDKTCSNYRGLAK
jgi:hypothetical protein